MDKHNYAWSWVIYQAIGAHDYDNEAQASQLQPKDKYEWAVTYQAEAHAYWWRLQEEPVR